MASYVKTDFEVFENARRDMAENGAEWWALRQGGREWWTVAELRANGQDVQARFTHHAPDTWRDIDGLSAIRGDE